MSSLVSLRGLFGSVKSIFCFLFFFCALLNAQEENLIDSFIRSAKNKSIPLKVRVDYNIAVADAIDENEMEPYCIEGLKLLSEADSVKYPYSDFTKNKTQLLLDLAFFNKAKGNFKKALSIYFDALVYAEKSKVPELIGDVHNNIGMLHFSQQQYSEALKELQVAIKSYNSKNDSSLIGRTLINVAGAYQGLKNYESAVSTFKSTIRIFENLKDSTYMAYCYNNLSVCYQYYKKTDSARYYIVKALPIFRALGNEDELAWTYDIMASIYWDSHKVDSTIKYCRKCIDIAVIRRLPEQLRTCSYNMYLANNVKGFYKEALKFYITADSVRDSLSNAGNRIALVKSQMQFDYNKKEELIRMESAVNDIKHEEENLRTKVILGFVSVFFVVLGIFAYFIFRNYKKEKLSKETITLQKVVIEEKQKEIIDSIKYAKRIQMSLLASEKYIQKSIEKLKGDKS
jgi:tetratricopeptide (TPR) repeat protein